mgnify:CR=1 FL=1
MEAFLREWFVDDEQALKNLSNGNFIIEHKFHGLIHPTIWESVIRPDLHVDFSFQLPSGASTPPVINDNDDDDVPETKYENRVQYKVNYFRRSEYGDRAEFIRESTYSEPVQLEIANNYDKLPALEERRDVTSEADTAQQGTGTDAKRAKPSKLSPTDVVGEATLKIHSPYLLNILKSVIEYSAEPPVGDNQGLDDGDFAYPYKDLYHHLDDLLRYKAERHPLRLQHSAAFNRIADEHIELLHKYLEFHPTIPFREAKARWTRTNPLTTFATLWLVMKPGADVYVREADGSLSRYVLDMMTGGVSEEYGKKHIMKYTAWVWNLILDDKAIRQYSRKVEVQIFDDERSVLELPIFPVWCHDGQDNGAVRQALIDRGRKYFQYSDRPCFLQYDGRGLKPGSRSVSLVRFGHYALLILGSTKEHAW